MEFDLLDILFGPSENDMVEPAIAAAMEVQRQALIEDMAEANAEAMAEFKRQWAQHKGE